MNWFRFLLLIAALASFGISAPAIRYAAAVPMVIVAWRATLVLVPLALMSVVRRQRWPLSGIPAGMFLCAYWLLWIAAVQQTSIARATLLVATGSLWAALLSRPLLNERIPPRQWLGLLLALAGVAMVVFAKDESHGSEALLGDLYALGGSLCWVCYTFVGRRARVDCGVWGYSAATHASAALAVIIWAASVRAPVFELSLTTWIAIAVLALFPTLIGQTVLSYLLRFIGPARLNLCLLSKPVVASGLAWLLFQETPAGWILAGGGITLVGLALGLVPRVPRWHHLAFRRGNQQHRLGPSTAR